MDTEPVHTDPNALLLQVMAHDLLAPLTAIKWQLELLERVGSDSDKKKQYMQNLHDSTELGITLTKHAHVAGRVLVGAYEQSPVVIRLSDVVRDASNALQLQFERHGVTLDVKVDEEQEDRTIDKELASLFTWAMAKYFLTCTPAQGTVSMRGIRAERKGVDGYILVGSATDVPECDACVALLNTLEARGTYDQTFVFAKLLHDLAELLDVNMSASTQGTNVLVEAEFKGDR